MIIREANSAKRFLFTVYLKINSAQYRVYDFCVGLVGLAAAHDSVEFFERELRHELSITKTLEVSAVVKDCGAVSQQLLPFSV